MASQYQPQSGRQPVFVVLPGAQLFCLEPQDEPKEHLGPLGEPAYFLDRPQSTDVAYGPEAERRPSTRGFFLDRYLF